MSQETSITKLYSEANFKPEQTRIQPMILLYGEAGIGKSTFASTFKNPFFFDFEARTAHIKNIARDRDYGISIGKKMPFNNFLTAIRELKDTPYQTIVFDGIGRLQTYIWDVIADKYNTDDPRGIGYGKGYSEVYSLFSYILSETKLLQRQYNKTIIFIDHEKLKEEETGAKKYQPECISGVLKIFTKEVDYIFRLVEDISTIQNAKTKAVVSRFHGLKILTNRQVHLDSMLKTSLPLPDSIIATAEEFGKAYKTAISA